MARGGNVVFKEVAVSLRDGCFYVDIAGSSIPLSLAPWGFNKDYCELCAYPHKHGYHKGRKEILRCDDEVERVVFYEATFAPGLYYGDFYEVERLKLDELYKHCRDLGSLLNYLNIVKPKVNLLSILILCCKVTSNSEFFEILGKAIAKSITVSLGTSLDRLNTIVTYVPRHKDEFKEDRFSEVRFNQAGFFIVRKVYYEAIYVLIYYRLSKNVFTELSFLNTPKHHLLAGILAYIVYVIVIYSGIFPPYTSLSAYHAFSNAFWVGIIGVGGYVGIRSIKMTYKFFKPDTLRSHVDPYHMDMMGGITRGI